MRLRPAYAFLPVAIGIVFGCGFDDSLRNYLDVHFWQPFSKHPGSFERKNVRRANFPFAGMDKSSAPGTALGKLRDAYREISLPVEHAFDPGIQQKALDAARADRSLTPREREEVDLIDAKISMRAGQPDAPEPLQLARRKLEQFIRTARTPEFRSEARGWLAHVHFLLGNQTAAGKIYLDELNRVGSNLSQDTLLNSLQMNYGYDGGRQLRDHLEEYFDTPEHAAFAIQLVTNPRWEERERYSPEPKQEPRPGVPADRARIAALLDKHRGLLESNKGANTLAVLSMRTALYMGNPPEALRLAAAVPTNASIRQDPDFNWMLASARFLSRDYAGAEQPLLMLFHSPQATENQKGAAAYGLCGVYRELRNSVEQIRFALWLHPHSGQLSYTSGIEQQEVYWSDSGWDLGLLLEIEAPVEALEQFLRQYPGMKQVQLVQYALAVRRARENRYEEAAKLYEEIHANTRAVRMRKVAALYAPTRQTDLPNDQLNQARYYFAEFLGANSERVYFNDRLWRRFQKDALSAEDETRLSREERERLISQQRKLQDDQEERWRAYLILRQVIDDEGRTTLGRKAARLAISCLSGISERFERSDEIRDGIRNLAQWNRR